MAYGCTAEAIVRIQASTVGVYYVRFIVDKRGRIAGLVACR
jgi:hypothetical protein